MENKKNSFVPGKKITVMHCGKPCEISVVSVRGKAVLTSIGLYEKGMLTVMKEAVYNGKNKKQV